MSLHTSFHKTRTARVGRHGGGRAARSRFAVFETLEDRAVPSTYTTRADFELGALFNVNADTSGNVQLSQRLSTYPVIWVANTRENTVSKWDVNSNRELARYFTWFGPEGQPGFTKWGVEGFSDPGSPSRFAVDRDGNVFVLNRQTEGNGSPGRPAEVIKILASGGIDRNGNGVIDTSRDLNGDGKVGIVSQDAPIFDAGEIFPLGDTNGNGKIDPEEIRDERIAWAVQVGPAHGLGHAIAVDADGNVWVGLEAARSFYKLSGETGQILAGPIKVTAAGPYGAFIDDKGMLWCTTQGKYLIKLDTKTQALSFYDHGQFGTGGTFDIAIGNGKVYLGAGLNGYSYLEFDPATETFSQPAAIAFNSRGVGVDRDGNILVSKAGGGAAKFRPDGTVIWNVNTPSTQAARGMMIDANGDAWTTDLGKNRLFKYSGVNGSSLGTFATGLGPYTYNDSTGETLFRLTDPGGSWTVVEDGLDIGQTWTKIAWNAEAAGSLPRGTSITVRARASDTLDGLGMRSFTPIGNNQGINLVGRYIEVKVDLNGTVGGASPILSDINILSGDPPLPEISIGDVSVVEGHTGTKNAVFVVSLSSTYPSPVTVRYKTSDDTATAGSDYEAKTLTTLTFSPGVTSQTLSVAINGDLTFEPDETFTVRLSAPVNATLANDAGVGTIINDDVPRPRITISDVSVVEGQTGSVNAVFTVTLSSAYNADVSVGYATADGTARGDSDYSPASGTLTFAPGVTSQTISVAINGELTFETDETFIVKLSAPVNVTIAKDTGVGTIINDDVPQPQISISDVSVVEGQTGSLYAVFSVTLSSAYNADVSVDFATSDGTARAGSDYSPTSGTLNFAPGTTTQTIMVPVLGDRVIEPDETFLVNLRAPINATIVRNQATGTIIGDDSSSLSITPRARLPRKKPPALSTAALAPIVREAKRRLKGTGLNADTLTMLDTAPIQIAILPGNLLAIARGGVVLIDRDAAGRGWFVDRTPAADSEFVKSKLRGANAQKVDLVTVVEHALGHYVGLQHAKNVSTNEVLAPGVRTLPRPGGLSARRFGK